MCVCAHPQYFWEMNARLSYPSLPLPNFSNSSSDNSFSPLVVLAAFRQTSTYTLYFDSSCPLTILLLFSKIPQLLGLLVLTITLFSCSILLFCTVQHLGIMKGDQIFTSYWFTNLEIIYLLYILLLSVLLQLCILLASALINPSIMFWWCLCYIWFLLCYPILTF